MANKTEELNVVPTTSSTITGTRKRARTTSTNEFMIVPDVVTLGSSSSSSSGESDVSFDCESINTSPRSSELSITSLEGDTPRQQKSGKETENDLTETLGTSLIALINSPWSGPFRDAVNPERSHFPDHFFEITEHPIDLYTIMEKLSDGCYDNNAWEYIDDVCLIFRNTWSFYKDEPQAYVYQYCVNLAKDFEREIEPVMQKLGHFCSDHKHTISPQTLCEEK